MKGITHIRIDDRLIHGQVAVLWSARLDVTRIMVINNDIAANPSQKNLMRMVVPEHINTSIIGIDKAVKNITDGNYDGERVMIVVKSPVELLEAYDKGFKFNSINIGNISARENTIKIKKGVFVLKEEFDALRQLEEFGVMITMMKIPDDPMEIFSSRDYYEAINDLAI